MIGIGVSIGANKESIAEARKAINDILRSKVADSVQLAALEALRTLCQVTGATVQDCTFNGGGK